MDCARIQPLSFTAAYKISGKSDAIEEVVGFFRHKKKFDAFDFIDFRLQQGESSQTEELLASTQGMDSKDVIDRLNHHLFDLFLIAKGDKRPFSPRNAENLDLILTGNEREIADTRLGRMVEDTVLRYGQKNAEIPTLRQRLEELINNSINNLYQGKPIKGINLFAIDLQMRPIFIDNAPVYPAERVIRGLEAGVFDYSKGVFA